MGPVNPTDWRGRSVLYAPSYQSSPNTHLKMFQLFLAFSVTLVGSMRVTRQIDRSEQRIEENPPQVCCRCIDESATCNNKIGSTDPPLGINCDSLECELFGDCDPSKRGCKVNGLTIVDTSDLLDLRDAGPSCPFGQKTCCDPGPGGGFKTRLNIPLTDGVDNDVEVFVDTQAICENPKLAAVQDFGKGIICGKRDSRVYFDAKLEETYTNPGEWPWAVLIFKDGVYIGAGAMMANDVVVTVGHKVKDFENNPSSLRVRLGDWNPLENDKIEEFPYIEVAVDCVKVHPDADLDASLENNVAVLKLKTTEDEPNKRLVRGPGNPTNTVNDIIDLRKAPRRPANQPKGVDGFSVREGFSSLDVSLGLVSEIPKSLFDLRQSETPKSYINTVCLPKSEEQFQNHQQNCWVAAWGQDLKRQREVDIPLVSRADCEQKLKPVFRDRGVPNWSLKPSEVCAGGVIGKDACKGEGGAPLVCYDKSSDQYFAVGLVSYGFGCNTDKPAVYTNLADRSVQDFINRAFDNDNFC